MCKGTPQNPERKAEEANFSTAQKVEDLVRDVARRRIEWVLREVEWGPVILEDLPR